MSDDHLNDEIKKRIGTVFKNYQDDTAEEGWLLLREKYPVKNEDRSVAWLWRIAGIAALLLAFLSIGLWLNFHPAGKQNTVAKNKGAKGVSSVIANAPIAKNSQNLTDSGPTIVDKKINSGASSSSVNTVPVPILSFNIQHKLRKSLSDHNLRAQGFDSSSTKTLAYKIVNKAKPSDITQSPVVAGHNPTNIVAAANNNFLPSKTTANNSTNPATVSSDTSSKPVTAALQAAEQNKSPAPNKPDKSIQSLFDNDKYKAAQNNSTEPKIKHKTVALAIYAATYVNYAKGSSKEFNAGGGLTADFRLTDNLSLSTGIGIAQNSLAYNSSTTQANVFPAAVTYSYKAVASSNFSQLSPSSQALNASLVNLDVPVNLKYIINAQKRNIYVLAGLSSGTFINETYKYTYNYSVPNNPSQSQEQSTNKAFDNFYFAKMFNVSFGVGYPLGKNQLIIEPFFKYPINGLGNQHILFGSGGVNLKINFDPPKK
jgi:hypothetical protein